MNRASNAATPSRRGTPTISKLARCLAAALALMGTPAMANTLQVTDCGDDGPGTLRTVVAGAADFDTVDIDSTVCGTITLTTGEIPINVSALYIAGVNGNPTITAGNSSRIFRHSGTRYLQLAHMNLTQGTYQRSSDALAAGGCIFSASTVDTYDVHLSYCYAIADHGPAMGGAIYANFVAFVYSTVSGSIAATSAGSARGGGLAGGAVAATMNSSVTGNTARGFYEACGGGIFATGVASYGSVVTGNSAITTSSGSNVQTRGGGICSLGSISVHRSSISGNTIQALTGEASGGGIFASSYRGQSRGFFYYDAVSGNTIVADGGNGAGAFLTISSVVAYSLFDHNQSTNNSALVVTQYPSLFYETTIANNVSTGSSAVFASAPIEVHESTIAFNQSGGSSAGLYLYPGGTALLQSALIAENVSTNGGGFDIVARDTIAGDHNLIERPGAAVPLDTIVGIDPELLPLANNGGPTLTAALRSTSLAIDHGAPSTFFSESDQRGLGYSRTFGIAPDIGAFEWQGGPDDSIFGNGFEP